MCKKCDGCYPEVCRCGCHPAPVTPAAKVRKILGIAKNVPGTKNWTGPSK